MKVLKTYNGILFHKLINFYIPSLGKRAVLALRSLTQSDKDSCLSKVKSRKSHKHSRIFSSQKFPGAKVHLSSRGTDTRAAGRLFQHRTSKFASGVGVRALSRQAAPRRLRFPAPTREEPAGRRGRVLARRPGSRWGPRPGRRHSPQRWPSGRRAQRRASGRTCCCRTSTDWRTELRKRKGTRPPDSRRACKPRVPARPSGRALRRVRAPAPPCPVRRARPRARAPTRTRVRVTIPFPARSWTPSFSARRPVTSGC